MGTYKRPMERSLLLSSAVFVVLMCVVLSAQTYITFSSWFYEQYNENLAHTIVHLEHFIDVDDLQECVRTKTPSPKFDELQAFVNGYVDDYDLAYLYLIIPRADGVMVSVCSATSAEERAAGEEDWPLLYENKDYYTPESIKPYLDAWNSDNTSEITYFESDSDWGWCYTACKMLVASDGEKVALLCADLYTDTMHQEINAYVLRNALVSSGIAITFVVLLLLWLRRDVTLPIQKLERSARNFAQRSHGHRDPSLLLFDDPHINTQNEVESLSDAISQMSVDMQEYVQSIMLAEMQAQSARERAEGMSRLAYEDALTHVRSKAAYALMVTKLKEMIAAGQAEFAILMVDLNNLKYVNDTYGHENGDKYLVGACNLMTEYFGDTPVYRTGGDEFVVVLRGEDYRHCSTRLRELQDLFAVTQADETVDPWECYSAACGMAKLRHNESYEDVFSRADRTMYRNKAKMKKHMKAYVMPR